VWLSLVDNPALPLPEFPQFDDPAYRVLKMDRYDWNCSAPRRLENVLDCAHFA
jgi:vanillate O-demethylase monooxygenase subunit